MDVGTFEAKTDEKTKKVTANLSMNLPFCPKMDFFCLKVDADKKKENSPDYLIFHVGNQIGGLWEKTANNEKQTKYFNGSIFMLGLPPNHKLFFKIFKQVDENGQLLKYKVVIPEDEEKTPTGISEEVF